MFEEQQQVVQQVDVAVAALAGLDLSALDLAQVEQLVRATQGWTHTVQGGPCPSRGGVRYPWWSAAGRVRHDQWLAAS